MTGKHASRSARQLALDDLALDLEADEEEEDRHQAVVDPEQQRLVESEGADLHDDRRSRSAS